MMVGHVYLHRPVAGAVFGKLVAQLSTASQTFYADAGQIADEAITMIRVVMSFGSYEREVARYAAALGSSAPDSMRGSYNKELDKAEQSGRKQGLAQGLGMGVTMMLIFFVDGFAFWYSGKLVFEEGVNPGDCIIVFFSVIIGQFAIPANVAPNHPSHAGAMAIGQGAPNFTSVSVGRGAALALFEVCSCTGCSRSAMLPQTIDRKPDIDSLSTSGKPVPAEYDGIAFENVNFAYPSRPDELVLKNISFKVPKNKVDCAAAGLLAQ